MPITRIGGPVNRSLPLEWDAPLSLEAATEELRGHLADFLRRSIVTAEISGGRSYFSVQPKDGDFEAWFQGHSAFVLESPKADLATHFTLHGGGIIRMTEDTAKSVYMLPFFRTHLVDAIGQGK